ncbi:MAG: V-type ATP synthase subunit A [Candidatus Omnitrophica bacterium]|nr:V-type ATP synthase subunit A [Candidatus Omnitrophota bacterium]
MEKRIGFIRKILGNMIEVKVDFPIIQNEIGFVLSEKERLKAEVIKIQNDIVYMQVFEETGGLKINDGVEFSGQLLSVELGPGLLGQIFDGLQNPLPEVAKSCGFFLKRGIYKRALSIDTLWDFFPIVKEGEIVKAGYPVGYVNEYIFKHYIMVPFGLLGKFKVIWIAKEGKYNLETPIAKLENERNQIKEVFLKQDWPAKIPIRCYQERLKPKEPLITKMRLIDTLFPIAKGGTYCIPGPFGAGKTVLQQLISKHAQVDIVVIAACGERAGEAVEVLKTFPEIIDPKTNRPLSERTVIMVNTSAMPVSARESGVYTAVTVAEYYRQMGLDVLLLADSTSRWAQAMREMSGKLEEIPGEEAFPAYLESRIAAFYERGGIVRLYDGRIGSLTIGGTVSPAGGNFEEPVTQATLKVVGAFLGLSRERSDARRYPAIDPLISWSKYKGIIEEGARQDILKLLKEANNILQMMKVVGEEGILLSDFITYLKAEFFDSVYLQQNAFDPFDQATSNQRQIYIFNFIYEKIIKKDFNFKDKDNARYFFQVLIQLFKNLNSSAWQSSEFVEIENQIKEKLESIKNV